MFGRSKSLIGMIHVGALPGTPGHSRSGESIAQIVRRAADEARLLAGEGFDALIIENMHDRPYIHGCHGPETVACMTRIAWAVLESAAKERGAAGGLPLGVQILSGGNREAVAVAHATAEANPAPFIRCENFVFAHVADEGLLAQAEAGPLLRYRASIGAESVRIFCDIKKKHASHAITADVPLADAVEAAEFFGADGVVVTGAATGKPTRVEDVAEARRAVGGVGGAESTAGRIPVLVGSGVTPDSLGELFEHADGLIVGSWFKHDGLWSNGPDRARVKTLIQAADKARS